MSSKKDNNKFSEELRKLRSEQLQLRSIMKAAPVGIGLVVDRKIEFVNQRFLEMVGYSEKELIGKNSRIVYSSDVEYDRVGKYKYEQIKVKGSGSIETSLKRKDGSIIDVFLSSTPLNPDNLSLGVTFTVLDITRRKKAEKAQCIENENPINIFKAMADGVYIVNQQYDIKYVNPILVKDFGVFEGRKCYEYFHDRSEVCPWCKNPDVFAGKTVRWEWYSSKNQKTYDLIDTPLKNSDDSISKLEIFRDITEKKQAEEAIIKSEKLLREIERITKIGSWEIDISTGKDYWSDEIYHIYELPLGSEISPEKSIKFYPNDAQEKIKSAFKKLIDTGESYDLELPFITAKSNRLWVRTIGEAEIKDGKTVRVFGNLMDITKRKESEEMIRQKSDDLELINTISEAANREGSFSDLVKVLIEGVKRNFECNGATVYILSDNKDYLQLQNLDIGSTLIKKIEGIINKKINMSLVKIPLKDRGVYTKLLRSGKPQLVNNPQMIQELMMEFTENEKLKKLIPAIFKLMKINSVINIPLISDGKAIGILDVAGEELFSESAIKRIEIIANHFISIIVRKQAEEAIQQNELKFRLLADYTYDWEYWIDPDGNYIYLSPSCERITGYSPEEFKSNPELLFEMVRSDYAEIIHQHYKDKNNKDSPVFLVEFPIINKNGEERWIEHNCSPVFNEQGDHLGRRGNNRDITERKLAEVELKSRNNELKVFNDLMVGRENRMIDLKSEINDLLVKQGETPKYEIPE